MVTKRFERVENTGKGKLLHNQVTAALDSMGRSISTQEKRQILMEILKTMCSLLQNINISQISFFHEILL